jgi:hypothetical protein
MARCNFKINLIHTLFLGKPALCFLSSDDTHSSGIMGGTQEIMKNNGSRSLKTSITTPVRKTEK